MCTVSMIGDHYRDAFPKRDYWSVVVPSIWPNVPSPTVPEVSRAEFDELRKDVLEMKELLKRAKAYDEANGEPDCEIDEKMALLKKIAAVVGVDLDDVLRPKGK